MKIQELLEIYQNSNELAHIYDALHTNPKARIHLKGLSGSGAAVVAAAMYQKEKNTQVFVFDDAEKAKYFYTDLQSLLEQKKILFLPCSFKRSYQPDKVENAQVLERAEVLNKLLHQSMDELIVTTTDALAERVMPADALAKNTYQVKVGNELDIGFFIDFLTEHHFERNDFVYEAGKFAIRGGIIDVYSFSNEMPYRIELNGDTIESIRTFNPVSQLSEKKVDYFYIIPNVQKSFETEQTASFQSLFDYLNNKTLFWFEDLNTGLQKLDAGIEKASKIIDTYTPQPFEEALRPAHHTFITSADLLAMIKGFSTCEFAGQKYLADTEIIFKQTPQPVFKKNFTLLIDNLLQNTALGFSNLIFSDSGRQIERLFSIFEDLNKQVAFQPVYHALSQGFIDHQLKLACYTEHQVFDRFYRSKHREAYSKSKIITLKELKDLKPGDFVTHIDHGVGKFAGLEKIEVNGHTQEAVRLVYRDNDLLYVSINSLHKIAKYSGKEGTEPRVNKLGSDAWEKLKNATKRKVKDIARDLIKLYAKRKAQSGFTFSPDNYLQTELEASFMYEDTPDQSKATLEFKKDMESANPMDRLVCGDVGFGKTEIAIRAAFKAVCDSKQVAVLVPTTILANQHYRTFKERLKDFPCNLDYINRFKTAAEQKAILQKVKEGKIDILIGTHKILSKEIKFKDLGLLIIDEEQKFGVAAKEKLKAYKVNVDTLTLTATPIPRTLHFSLMGARDLSIINTPPPNRQPVTTELHAFNDELLREAVMNEVERRGQVFVVHHRVKDIHDIAERISRICDNVKVGVAHGQLEGDQLEDVMMRFIEGDYDVLVATTIIESGLDIPNANTIIINNAHMFGLSDLHQMRGRVGRTNKKAFCYLLVPSMSTLTDDARRRLQAIEEYSDLGSGFNVAMRDLDIRGAGNLLGGEQSGFIAEVGFEMYHKILDEAVEELKEEEFADLFKETTLHKIESKDCTVETDYEALIPDDYVRNITERLSLYKELSGIHSEGQLAKYAEAMADRFGPLPQQVTDLLEMIRVREMAKQLGIEKLVLKNDKMMAYFPDERKEAYYQSEVFSRVLKYVQHHSDRCRMKQSGKNLVLVVQHLSGFHAVKSILQGMALQAN